MQIFKEHFIPNLSPDIAKLAFKQSINKIEMAISSYCNKRCIYCPNHVVDRNSVKHYMSDELFLNIMNQLRSIEYSGVISIHRYNEPLADKNKALLRISSIRSFIPKANLVIYTNGDYLNKDLLLILADLGVTLINATLHSENTTYEELILKLKSRVEKLELPFTFHNDTNNKSCHAQIKLGNLSLRYQVADFFAKKDNGAMRISNRGGSIDNCSNYGRLEPCLTTFNEIQIEYDGTLLPCCNIHSGLDIHKNYILGKLENNGNLFVEWTNHNYVNWRKKLITFGAKGPPCTNCEDSIVVRDTPDSRLMCDDICKMFSPPMVE